MYSSVLVTTVYIHIFSFFWLHVLETLSWKISHIGKSGQMSVRNNSTHSGFSNYQLLVNLVSLLPPLLIIFCSNCLIDVFVFTNLFVWIRIQIRGHTLGLADRPFEFILICRFPLLSWNFFGDKTRSCLFLIPCKLGQGSKGLTRMGFVYFWSV